jgi:RHS repeat-associated protein
VSASFVYDGVGRREKKTISGNLTEFLYDGVNPVQETSGAAILANNLTGLGIDEFFARTDVPAGIMSHFLPDALGSALALADPAGAVQTEYIYEAFGKAITTGASNMNSFQYTGRENDGTGLYYYRARYFDPVSQRFIAEDPLEFTGGDINLYAYVLGNPLSYIDPLGLDITVRLYQGAGGYGHVGIGVYPSNTVGFYPAPGASTAAVLAGQPVPGKMLPDNRREIATVRIPANSAQDQAVQECIDERTLNPGVYDLNGRNCTTIVRDALRRAGIDTTATVFPKELMHNLQRQFGSGMPRL